MGRRLATFVTLSSLLLTGCPWIPGLSANQSPPTVPPAGSDGNAPGGEPVPEFTLDQARLETTEGMPGQEVIVAGVPSAFSDVAVTLTPSGGQEEQKLLSRRVDGDRLAVSVPLVSDNAGTATEVELTVASGSQRSPKLKLQVKALPPVAEGTAERILDSLQDMPTVTALAMGVQMDESVLRGDPAQVPESLKPLALAQQLIDDPENPNSVKAILSGTAPILQEKAASGETFQQVIVSSGLLEAIEAYNRVLTESAVVSGFKGYGAQSVAQNPLDVLDAIMSPEQLSRFIVMRENIDANLSRQDLKVAMFAFDSVLYALGFKYPQLAVTLSSMKLSYELSSAFWKAVLPAGYKSGVESNYVFTRVPGGYPLLDFENALAEVGDGFEFTWNGAKVVPVTQPDKIDLGQIVNVALTTRASVIEQRTALAHLTDLLRKKLELFKLDKWVVIDHYALVGGLYGVFGEMPAIVKFPPKIYAPVDVTAYCSIYQPQVNNIQIISLPNRAYRPKRGVKALLKVGLYNRDGLYFGKPIAGLDGAVAGGTKLIELPCPAFPLN